MAKGVYTDMGDAVFPFFAAGMRPKDQIPVTKLTFLVERPAFFHHLVVLVIRAPAAQRKPCLFTDILYPRPAIKRPVYAILRRTKDILRPLGFLVEVVNLKEKMLNH